MKVEKFMNLTLNIFLDSKEINVNTLLLFMIELFLKMGIKIKINSTRE